MAKGVYRAELLQRFPAKSHGAIVEPHSPVWVKGILHAVNPQLLYVMSSWSYYVDSGYEDAEHLLQMRQIQRVAASMALDGIVRVVCADPIDVGNRIKAQALDWIYIGANRARERTYLIARLWARKVKPGGYVIGQLHGLRHPAAQAELERCAGEMGVEQIEYTIGARPCFWWSMP